MTTKIAEGKPARKSAVMKAAVGLQKSVVQYRVLRSLGANLNLIPTCGHWRWGAGSGAAGFHFRARGRRVRPPQFQWTKTRAGEWPWPMRAATHRSLYAVRRPFLTALHSRPCLAPVLGRQFSDSLRLLFRHCAVRILLSNVRLLRSHFCDRLRASKVRRDGRLDLRTTSVTREPLPCEQLLAQ